MSLPKVVRIVEVAPRDGLQNESQIVPTAIKAAFIQQLSESGLTAIEAASFVSPKWVPQMGDAVQLMKIIERKPGVSYSALIPNMRGLEAALDAQVTEVAVFAAASEAFSQKNINCSIQESLHRFLPVLETATKQGIRVRGYVSCALGCPYQGTVAVEKVAEVAKALYDMGCYEISLGDTIGVGTPLHAQRMIAAVARNIPINILAAHFHDTYGQALANLFAVFTMGIAIMDSAVAGLGGCPYAKGASGNVATEDLVYMLNGMEIETGVDLQKLLTAGQFMTKYLGKSPQSRLALLKKACTE